MISAGSKSDWKSLREFRVPDFELRGKKQGNRGTCAVMAAIALLEYYYKIFRGKSGDDLEFSPQYLYARCKLEEKNNTSGTDIDNVFRCIQKYGVCEDRLWPYNSHDNGSEAQVTSERLKDLPTVDFSGIDFQMLRTPDSVDEYKSILCGANGCAPMPIVIGCKIFRESGIAADDVNCSLERPKPWDDKCEGHAMLIYGWKDTPGLDSKGYFIAQNSWNDVNTRISIPYEYVTEYAVAAGTLKISGVSRLACPAAEPQSARLKEEKQEAIVCSDSISPGTEYCLSSEESSIKEEFFSSQRANLGKESYPLPSINRFTAPISMPSVNTELLLKQGRDGWQDESLDFADFLKKKHRNASERLWAQVIIYKIEFKPDQYYRLVSAFLIHKGGHVDGNDIGCLRDFVENYYSQKGLPTLHWFYTIGTAGDFDKNCEALPDPTVFLCRRCSQGIWAFKIPVVSCGPATEEFFRHILPGTGYKKAVESLILGNAETHTRAWDKSDYITKSKLKNKLGVPAGFDIYDPVMNAALNELFRQGGYGRMKEPKNPEEDAIYPPGWNWPSGVKECCCWTEPFMRVKLRFIVFWSSVLLLSIGSFVIFQILKIKSPLYLSIALTLLSSWLAKQRTKAMLAYKYNIK